MAAIHSDCSTREIIVHYQRDVEKQPFTQSVMTIVIQYDTICLFTDHTKADRSHGTDK